MPVRRVILPTDRNHFGFVDRLYVHLNLPRITELHNGGLSVDRIAAELNVHGLAAMNGNAWDAKHVIGIIKRDEQIRASDLVLRLERNRSY